MEKMLRESQPGPLPRRNKKESLSSYFQTRPKFNPTETTTF